MAALRSSLRHYRLFSTTAVATPLTTSAVKAKFRSEHDPDKAIEIYYNLSDADISPIASRFALNHTVKRLAKSGRLADIETLVESHKKHPKITQEGYFSTLIRSYGTAGMLDNALRLFNEMEELGTPRSPISFNALLLACNMSRKFDQVRKLFDEIPQKYEFLPNEISYGILIKSLCELGSTESIFSTLKEMGEKNIGINTITFTTILDALYKKGNVEDAEKIWKQMIEKGCVPDVPAYNVRIMHACKEKPEDVLAVFDEMASKGLKPDAISYNYLLTCYFKNHMIEDAQKVYRDLEENGCFPNAATFKLYIFHLCKNGYFEDAYEVFKESVKRDKIPPFQTLKSLVEELVKKSKRQEAKELIATMNEKYPNAWNKVEEEFGLSKDEPTPAVAFA